MQWVTGHVFKLLLQREEEAWKTLNLPQEYNKVHIVPCSQKETVYRDFYVHISTQGQVNFFQIFAELFRLDSRWSWYFPLEVLWVLWCFVHVCFVQVTILNIVWRSRLDDAPRCAHFSTDICCVIQEGVITVEKCAHQGTSAHWVRHTLSLGQNKHG